MYHGREEIYKETNGKENLEAGAGGGVRSGWELLMHLWYDNSFRVSRYFFF